jgi:hypothetical protein
MDTKTGKPKADSPKSVPWNQSRCVLTQDVERLVRETIGCATANLPAGLLFNFNATPLTIRRVVR